MNVINSFCIKNPESLADKYNLRSNLEIKKKPIQPKHPPKFYSLNPSEAPIPPWTPLW